MTLITGLPLPAPELASRDSILMQKAQELEASFLAEMLAQGGLGKAPEDFGGGPGEAQFASFLRAEQARLMVARGGIGLAEGLFRAMGGGRDGG